MNVRIFSVRAMECMWAQTRPRYILSSERVLRGMESELMLTPREKSPLPKKIFPEEYRIHNAASSRTASPTHYQWAIPAPVWDRDWWSADLRGQNEADRKEHTANVTTTKNTNIGQGRILNLLPSSSLMHTTIPVRWLQGSSCLIVLKNTLAVTFTCLAFLACLQFNELFCSS